MPRVTKVALTACSSPSDSPLRYSDRPPGSASTPSARPTRRVQADNAKQEGTGQIPTPGSGFEAPPPGRPGAQAPPSSSPGPPIPTPAQPPPQHFRQALRCWGARARMAAENEASQESALGAYSPVDYMSITSFPRLPEDEPAPAVPLRGRKDEDAFLGDPDTGEARLPHPCPLGRLWSSFICAEHHLQLQLPNSFPSSWTSPFSSLVSVNFLVGLEMHLCLGGLECDKGEGCWGPQ